MKVPRCSDIEQYDCNTNVKYFKSKTDPQELNGSHRHRINQSINVVGQRWRTRGMFVFVIDLVHSSGNLFLPIAP